MKLIIFGIALLLFSTTALASNGMEGLGYAFLLLIGFIMVIIAIAVIIGAVLGGTRAKQKHKSIVSGVFFGGLLGFSAIIAVFATIAIAGYFVFIFPNQVKEQQDRREETVYQEWLKPVENLQSGTVRSTLNTLLTHKPNTNYTFYNNRLSFALTQKLNSYTQRSLTEDDLAALNDFYIHSADVNYKTELQAAIAWAGYLLDAESALRICQADQKCQFKYLQHINVMCSDFFGEPKLKMTYCRQELNLARLHLILSTLKAMPPQIDNQYNEPLASQISFIKLAARFLSIGHITGSIEEILATLAIIPEYNQGNEYSVILEQIVKSLQQFDKPISLEDRQALDKFMAAFIEFKKKKKSLIYSGNIIKLKSAIIWAYYQLATEQAIYECGVTDDKNSIHECQFFYKENLVRYCKQNLSICNTTDNQKAIRLFADSIMSSNLHKKEEIYKELTTLQFSK